MKGFFFKREDGKYADCAPCKFCKHKNKMTVEHPCYNCISTVDLALHKPNAETEFAYFEAESEDRLNQLLELQILGRFDGNNPQDGGNEAEEGEENKNG